jgi:uncharacterized membrane protein
MPLHPGGGAESQITIFGHPVHPMLVTFPIAFFSAVVATDGAYWWFGDEFWAYMSFWLLVGGVVMGGLAALVGASDFTLVSDIRRHLSSWNHFLAAIVTMALGVVNLLQRLDNPVEAVWPWGIGLSCVTVVVLGAAGWLGGKMVFEHNLGPGEPLRDAPDISKQED